MYTYILIYIYTWIYLYFNIRQTREECHSIHDLLQIALGICQWAKDSCRSCDSASNGVSSARVHLVTGSQQCCRWYIMIQPGIVYSQNHNPTSRPRRCLFIGLFTRNLQYIKLKTRFVSYLVTRSFSFSLIFVHHQIKLFSLYSKYIIFIQKLQVKANVRMVKRIKLQIFFFNTVL